MWGIFYMDPYQEISDRYALYPKTGDLLTGIIGFPMLHGNFGHIMDNTTLLAPLMVIMAMVERNFWPKIALMIVGSGALLWMLGPVDVPHVGASGLLFAVMGFLAVAIVQRGKIVGLAILLALVYLLSDMLFASLAPQPPPISILAHWLGLIVGAGLALVWRSRS